MTRAFPDQSQDPLLLNHFVNALPSEFRSAVVAAGCETFDQAVAKVRNLKSAYSDKSMRSVSTPNRDPEWLPALLTRIEQLELAVSGGPGGARTAARGRVAPRQAGQAVSSGGAPGRAQPMAFRDQMTCWSCGMQGHLRRDCPQRRYGGRGTREREGWVPIMPLQVLLALAGHRVRETEWGPG